MKTELFKKFLVTKGMIGTNGSSVAFQKQEIATLDKFYLYHTPEILRSPGPNFQLQMKGFIFQKSGKSFFSKIQSFEALDCQPPRSRGLASRTQTKQVVFVKTEPDQVTS